MQKIFNAIIFIFIFAIIFTSNIIAGEVELFIPPERAEKFIKEDNEARKLEYQKRYNSFKKTVDLSSIHENTLITKVDDVVTPGGAVIIDDDIEVELSQLDNTKTSSNIISDTNYIHENVPHSNLEVATNEEPKNITIHENSIEFTNFIVHENTINHKYSQDILAADTPDKDKVWTSATSQATLLFSASAKERDQAINNLINNGRWLKVAEKLLDSKDDIIRLNGISIIKTAIDSPKYKKVPLSTKVNKLSPFLISSLKDSNSKVRFIASLILSKLTGNNFDYKFNDDPMLREQAITVWDQHIKTNFGS